MDLCQLNGTVNHFEAFRFFQGQSKDSSTDLAASTVDLKITCDAEDHRKSKIMIVKGRYLLAFLLSQ
jgi:hypothetical protein